jgi:protein TonB
MSLALHAVALSALRAPVYVSSPDTIVRIRLLAPNILASMQEPVSPLVQETVPYPGKNTVRQQTQNVNLISETQDQSSIIEQDSDRGQIGNAPPSQSGNGLSGDAGGSGSTAGGGNESSEIAGNSHGSGENSTPAIDRDALIAGYREQVLAAISAHKEYPPAARRTGREGEIRISFRVGGNGIVSNVEVVSSSGSEVLDRAAIKAVEESSPLPSPPAALGESLSLTLTVVFSLD